MGFWNMTLEKSEKLIVHTLGRFQKDGQRQIMQNGVVIASVALMATLVAIRQFVVINIDLGS